MLLLSKRYFFVLIIIFCLPGCWLKRMKDEADAARQQSDSIMRAFKKVNESLDTMKAFNDKDSGVRALK